VTKAVTESFAVNRRSAIQLAGGVFAATWVGGAAVAASAGPSRMPLRRDEIAIAVLQTGAASLADVQRDIDRLFENGGRKDLVCLPDLPGVEAAAFLGQAGHFNAYMIVGARTLITPEGVIAPASQSLHATAVGTLALLPRSTTAAQTSALIAQGAEIIVAASHDIAPAEGLGAYTVITARVNEMGGASGSAIFGPSGEMLALAGTAWAQTVAATVPLASWREQRDRAAITAV